VDQHYSTAFLERFARADLDHEMLLFGEEARSTSLSSEGVSVATKRHMNTTVVVDDFGSLDGSENLLGGANDGADLSPDANDEPYTEGLVTLGRGTEVAEHVAGFARSRHVGFDGDADLTLALSPDGLGLPLDGHQWLVGRVMHACPPPPWSGDDVCGDVDVDFGVALWDTSGGSDVAWASSGMGDLGIVGRHWGDVALPLGAFEGVDLGALDRVELLFEGSGELWLDDLRFE
jgi:hypothetical protein